ncbi:deoxycytidyl transferase [Entomortierella chlamydospora]|uniref:DNA repair protein REV1 n=1 Tax=Entomortierella chlamydospora TaxID=101097 RepID=A0A9P6MY46_9FUNG|nr:deoxycytidyl transferase [Entomortierella chlamydospora]
MLAKRVREEIFLATGCHASVGVAPNVLLAKLSTKRAKPHGQFIWPGAPGSEETLCELRGPKSLPVDIDIDTSLTPSSSEGGSQHIKHDLPVVDQSNNLKGFSVNDLPGVGYKTKQELQERFSVQTLYELQQISKEELQRICGMKTGEMLYNSCRGIDETTLASDRDKARQSVSAEISWGVRFENQDQVDVFLRDLAREVSKRLKEIDRKGKSIVMKVMKRKEYVAGRWKHLGHGPVDQFVRTGQLPMYTDDPDVIAKEAHILLQHFKIDVLDLRGLGIQVLKLNNDVINGVPRTAFASLDSMNQTTLSTAMFQRKALTPNASDSVDSSKIQLSEHQAPLLKSMELSGYNSEVSQGDLTLEIDNETFKELPTDIQEELLRHHRFVFVNQNGSETTITASSKEMQLNSRPGLDSCVSLHHGSKDKDLPQTAVDHVLPPWSQVDPAELVALSTPMMRDTLSESVLQSLPPEIRAEIEQEYTHIMENNELIRKLARPTSNHTADNSSVSLLHQPVFTDNQGGSRGRGKSMRRGSTRGRPRGRGRGRGRELGNLSNGIECVRIVRDDVDEALRESREKESQHKSLQESVSDRETSSGDTHVPPLDSEFLAALPPDIRAELETAHKVEIMKSRRKRATQAALTKDQSTAVYDAEYSKECRTRVDRSVLIERPTLMGLSHLDEIRDMLGEWVQSTLLREEEGATNIHDVHDASSSANPRMIIYDEGPNPEDVWSFSEYIARVIFMERDLDKARLLLRFLERKIEDNKRKATPTRLSPKHLQVLISWPEALKSISSVAEHLVAVLYGGTFATD